uniref:DUF4220 domain-containing protein n=1 Tax=Setaria italica TaxID=4555 RepID=K3ZM44_SETIT
MALAPSPTPQVDALLRHSQRHDMLSLDYVVALFFVAVVAMFLLHILGPLRRWLSHGLLHHIVMGVYTLSYPLVGYTIGLMQSTKYLYLNDFTVWAVFLLLLLTSTDSLTACRLDDIDNWKSIYVKQLFKGFIVVFIVLKFCIYMELASNLNYLWYPLSAILVVIVLKSYLMIASMRMVSKSYHGKNVKVIAEYMQHIDNKLVAFDPVTMEGYRYMVAGEKHCVNQPGHTPWYKKPDDLKLTTVEQIWQCEGNLLIGDQGKVLKDLCLSMALSKMLNRRFAGFKLSEAELEKTHDFVFKGLLAGDEQRVFRVIEEELVFVHDMYYTRYSYLYQKVASLHVKRDEHTDLSIDSFQDLMNAASYIMFKHITSGSLMSGTIVITVVLAFLEAYQLYLYMASGWFKVALIRSYVTAPFLQTSYCSEMIIRLLLMLKPFRPWKGRLGQYCFLENLGRKSKVMSCLHYGTLCMVDKAMKGSKKSVKLSKDVKKAIIDSLLASNGHLTNGVTSLQRNGVHDDLKWACDGTATDGAVARTIVVWHIATTLCEQKLDKQAKEQDAVKTASTLSKYCMHLLAFAPNLLPDHSSISESILRQSIDEASKILKEAKNNKIDGRCETLMEINTDGCVDDETILVARGVHLARQLMIDNIQDFTTRWKVLSDFWEEMMLYVSPSDDARVRVHLEVLPRGGEFITHLWALLTHAGVLKRGSTEPKDVV